FDRKRNCYIANIVKCRPPGNRAPEPAERQACWPYLRAQIRLVRPKIIVLLGATALQGIIDPSARITRMRGQWIEREGIHFMPTYHPAALLRDPSKKKDVWNDMKQVIARYRELVDPNHYSPYA
ncbi:uracil-DNA glycosylase, partial [Symbiobacterium thermophilum]